MQPLASSSTNTSPSAETTTLTPTETRTTTLESHQSIVSPEDEFKENYSLSTLPDGLEVKWSKIPNSGFGVFAKKLFEIGTRFGPYEGQQNPPTIVSDESVDTSYMWEVSFLFTI